ncbi:MAG: hypothetical protein QM204_02065 [Bacillota bacterium]|jgi:hypothetical protein|nr:hypothetical protein [Bacillota bacterium]NLL26088.1 hypothetical protein [Erysipelotrichia bacterium]
MKKKLIVVTCILLLVLLFPTPLYLKDGGTVEYKAILYKISKVHRIASDEDREADKEFYEGIIIEVFGIEIFNNVK